MPPKGEPANLRVLHDLVVKTCPKRSTEEKVKTVCPLMEKLVMLINYTDMKAKY